MSEHEPEDEATISSGLIAPGGKVDPEALYELYSRQADSGEGDDRPIAVTFRLNRDLGKRLDRYLVDRVPFLSRTALQRLIDEGAVTVNNRVPKASTRLRLGDVIVAVLPPPPSSAIPAEPIPLDILYEDSEIVVLNKQANLIVHPARGNLSGTLINGLAWHFQSSGSGQLSSVGEENTRPGVVHRLDRHTTGVMVVAKTDTAHWRLGRQFEQRRTSKRYLAVVHGRMEPIADLVDMPLGKHPTVREKYAVRWDESGKSAQTVYRVRELYRDHSLVEVELRTGRTHQIRVHLSHIGYPIVGDDMYGGRHLALHDLDPSAPRGSASEEEWIIRRQALHAATLGFTHPITREPRIFAAPAPTDLRELIGLLRRHHEPERLDVPGVEVDVDAILGVAEE